MVLTSQLTFFKIEFADPAKLRVENKLKLDKKYTADFWLLNRNSDQLKQKSCSR
jgi:hypothetical protein